MAERHLIMDWNGTLIDDLDAAVAGVNIVLTGQGVPPIGRDQYRRHFGFPIEAFYARLGVDFGRISFPELGRQYLAHFNEAIRSCSLFPGAFELIALARRHGYSVSILSASERNTLFSNLREMGLLDLLDHVYGLEDEGARGKLDLAQRLDVALGRPGGRALMIGDTEHDVEVAVSLGWRVHSVSHGHQSRERLVETHDAVSESLLELIAIDLLSAIPKENIHA
jgi:phosphoglycolate phosphatase